jgi:hypothetical protein
MSATTKRARVIVDHALRRDLRILKTRQRELHLLGDERAATHLKTALESIRAARMDLVDGDA